MTVTSTPTQVKPMRQVLYRHPRIGDVGIKARAAVISLLYRNGLTFTKHCPECHSTQIHLDEKGWGECRDCELKLVDV